MVKASWMIVKIMVEVMESNSSIQPFKKNLLNKLKIIYIISNEYILFKIYIYVVGDWGLGIGDWGLGVGANTPKPKPQTPNPT